MKKVMFFCFISVALLLTSCNTQKNQQVSTYYSSDSLFSISVPSDYSLYSEPLANYIAYQSENQKGIITIKKDSKMNASVFEEFINQQVETTPSKFSREIVEKNDSITHYKFSAGMFVIHQYFMWKKGEVNDYLLSASGTSLESIDAQKILTSVKEYSVIELTPPKTKDNYSYYNKAGFAIEKTYNLMQNKAFIQLYKSYSKKEDARELLAAYTCSQNAEKNDPNLINIINVNVEGFDTKTNGEKILANYKVSLDANGFKYNDIDWNGISAVEYTFNQNFDGTMIPTKAIYGYKGNKLFLLQISSLSNIESKFKSLKNSVIIL